MTALAFLKELPAAARLRTTATSHEVQEFADALRANPGRWAAYPWSGELTPKSRRSRACDINAGRVTAPRAMRCGFEAAVRDGVLYIRYVGGGAV